MADEPEDWHVRRKRYEAFINTTELGKLFIVYEKALVDYWQVDPDDDRKMMEFDKKAKDATHAFITKSWSSRKSQRDEKGLR